MPQQPALRVDEQKLNDVFNEHLRAEFGRPDETIATMIANLLVEPGAGADRRPRAQRSARLLREPFRVTNPAGHGGVSW